jgi:hypothetical protein
MGERIDELLARFGDLRIEPDRIEETRLALHHCNDTDRRLLLVDLADHLEKYVDLGILYFGESDWVTGASDRIGRELIEIADELGEPRLGEMMSRAFSEAAAQAAEVPAELRTSDGRRYLKLVTPRSCRRRVPPRLRAGIRELRRHLRPRSRLRRLPSGVGHRIRA